MLNIVIDLDAEDVRVVLMSIVLLRRREAENSGVRRYSCVELVDMGAGAEAAARGFGVGGRAARHGFSLVEVHAVTEAETVLGSETRRVGLDDRWDCCDSS